MSSRELRLAELAREASCLLLLDELFTALLLLLLLDPDDFTAFEAPDCGLEERTAEDDRLLDELLTDFGAEDLVELLLLTADLLAEDLALVAWALLLLLELFTAFELPLLEDDLLATWELLLLLLFASRDDLELCG